MAVFVSIDLNTRKIGIKEWEDGDLHDFLITHNPVISAINDDNDLEFQEEMRETPRTGPYDLEAEEGMIRYRRTPRGELVIIEGEPVTEETVKVWPGSRGDIRLIKFVDRQREEILCRSFSWENKENPEISSRFAPGSKPNLPNVSLNIDRESPAIPSRFAPGARSNLPNARLNVDAVIQQMKKYTPEFENVKNEEVITFYKEHPLKCFMPNCSLFRVGALQVQRWVYEQFYRKEGENKERFEYMNFVSAKKIVFSFGKGVVQQNSPGMEAWHVEMKRQAGWVLQLPIGIRDFFAGIFLANAQNPPKVDKKAMERFMQGVPLLDPERNKIVDDFAVELGACSIINFYIACDRSASQLEINGRAWVRSFANTGRGIGAIIPSAEGLAHLFQRVNMEDVNRAVENVARLGENANRVARAWEVVRGGPPPQDNPANE